MRLECLDHSFLLLWLVGLEGLFLLRNADLRLIALTILFSVLCMTVVENAKYLCFRK